MDSGNLMIQDSILVCSPDPRIPHTAHHYTTNMAGPLCIEVHSTSSITYPILDNFGVLVLQTKDCKKETTQKRQTLPQSFLFSLANSMERDGLICPEKVGFIFLLFAGSFCSQSSEICQDCYGTVILLYPPSN
jgi:hypothetical protein